MTSKNQLARVRRICMALPEAEERLSHSAETFFVRKKVFTMFLDNHHGDGRLAVWLPVPPGMQAKLLGNAPDTYFKPPYVGVRGWIGIHLAKIGDDELTNHIEDAWEMVAPKRLLAKLQDQ